MSDISVDQKLQLIEQVRSQYHKDQYDLSHREQILYGRTSQDSGSEELPARGSLRLRVAAALVLLVLVILMDQKEETIMGITTAEIFHTIENDYLAQMEEMLNGIQLGSEY